MIDTIVLRLHNVSNYPNIINRYYYAKNTSKTNGELSVQNGKLPSERITLPGLFFGDTSSFVPAVHRSTITLSSHHYLLAYSYNPIRNYLEFNFSIPKMIFSTNVFQFLSRYDYSVSNNWKMLQNFLNDFIKDYLGSITLMDLELNRIDFCFNQFFNTKTDALNYLDQQKNLLAKYAPSSGNNFRSYDTSLMYVTKRYSFKIYHKGTEFKKHDLKQINKLLPDKISYQTVNKLNEVSEYILRYEMTFRNKMISYLFNQFFLNPLYEKRAIFDKKFYLQNSTCKDFYSGKMHLDFAKNDHNFFFSTVSDFYADAYPLQYNDVTFDKSLYTVLHAVFMAKVKDYQITNVPTTQTIDEKIKEHNERAKNYGRYMSGFAAEQKQISNLKMFALLSNFLNPIDLKKMLPHRTYYDLKKRAKNLGIELGNGFLNIPTPSIDYGQYFQELGLYHPDKYF